MTNEEFLTPTERKLQKALDSALELFGQTDPFSKDEAEAFRQHIQAAQNLIVLRNITRVNEKQYPSAAPEMAAPEMAAPEETPAVGPSEFKDFAEPDEPKEGSGG